MLTMEIPISDTLSKRIPVTEFTSEMEQYSREKFEKYKKDNVILNECYDDDEWVLTNQESKSHVKFRQSEFEVRKICRNYMDLVKCLKIYAGMRLGVTQLKNIQALISAIIREYKNSNGFKKPVASSEHLVPMVIIYVIEFVKLFQDYEQIYIKNLEKICVYKNDLAAKRRKNSQPMEMCDFETYFKFHEIINSFWTTATEIEKDIYYPLYIYWNTTSIIPQRPTEFSIIIYDCIEENDGRYYIIVRRTRMKGSAVTVFTYKKDKDYYFDKYEINKFIYDAINDYRQRTKEYSHPYEELFSLQFLKDRSGKTTGKQCQGTSFGNRNMNKLLHMFYEEIICDRLNYTVIPRGNRINSEEGNEKDCYLMSDEIMLIRLKDTRHLAMTNLIMRGCSPMTIMEFAGHTDMAMSANYYKAISKLVKCATKYYYDKSKNRINSSQSPSFIRPSFALLIEGDEYIEVDEGLCYSKAFINGNASDCISVDGQCRYCKYCKLNADINLMEQHISQKVDEEIDFVIKLLKNAETENEIITMQKRMAEIESDMNNLSFVCWRRLVKEEYETEIYDERSDGLYKEVCG